MTVCKTKIFDDTSRGSGLVEVLMAMAVLAVAAPFVYSQVVSTVRTVSDVRVARQITDMRGPVLNFVRMHGDSWPAVAQIRLSEEDLGQIAEFASAGFVDKYDVAGTSVTDVYLAFDLATDALRTASVARYIGQDAAVVGDDGVAYGDTWAVTAPDFVSGNLIYRITRDVTGIDTEKFLHRGTSGEDYLNVMQRDLNMGGHNVYDIGGVNAKSAKIVNVTSTFVETPELVTDAAYFSAGAKVDGGAADLGAMRVTGDITGFRNINALTLNGKGYTTQGHVISDRATVTGEVHVSRDLVLKSDTTRTISGFDGIAASTVIASSITTDEIIFYDNFGLTLSAELLMSTTPPLKIGSWTFPNTSAPKFTKITISRGTVPAMASKTEFAPLLQRGWRNAVRQNEVVQNVF